MVVFMNFCTICRLNRCQVMFIIRTEMIVYSLTLLRVQSSFACRGRTRVSFVTWLNDGVSTVICLAFHDVFFHFFSTLSDIRLDIERTIGKIFTSKIVLVNGKCLFFSRYEKQLIVC